MIGSGATAVTLVPEMAKTAAHVTILQRSPTYVCLLYTSDAADERSSVDLGGRRHLKKKTNTSTVDDYPESTYKND